MKKYVMVFGLVMVSTIIFAQGNSKERAEIRADRMKTELTLDDVQYKAVKAINEEYDGKLLQVKSDSSLSKDEGHQKIKALIQEKDAAIKKVLTEEQNTKWASHQKTKANRNRAHMKKSHNDHALKMQKDLSLSEEQISKMKTMDSVFAAKFRALRRDSTVAKDDLRERMKELRSAYHTKTKAVLTREQFEKWEAEKVRKRKN